MLAANYDTSQKHEDNLERNQNEGKSDQTANPLCVNLSIGHVNETTNLVIEDVRQ